MDNDQVLLKDAPYSGAINNITLEVLDDSGSWKPIDLNASLVAGNWTEGEGWREVVDATRLAEVWALAD